MEFQIENSVQSETRMNSRMTTDNIERQDPHRITRKAIDRCCTIGSLYNAIYDIIIDGHMINPSKSSELIKYSKCQIESGCSPTLRINALEKILHDQELFASLLLEFIQPSGITRIINDLSPSDDKTRLFYYTFHAGVDRLDDIRTSLKFINQTTLGSPIRATHLITEIIYGFEILAVCRLPDDGDNDRLDSFLDKLAEKLNHRHTIEDHWSREEMDDAHQIKIISLYGSERFANNSIETLFRLLQMIVKWQMNPFYHYPIEYQMISLRQVLNHSPFLYSGVHFGLYHFASAMIKSSIFTKMKHFAELRHFFLNIPNDLSIDYLNWEKDQLENQYESFIKDYRQYRIYLRILLIQIRRNYRSMFSLMLIILQNQYPTLMESSLRTFQDQLKSWMNKIRLIQRLHNDHIEYFHVNDPTIPNNQGITNILIDQALYDRFSDDHQDVLLCYVNDQMNDFISSINAIRSEHPTITRFIYVDVTFSNYKLDELLFITFSRKILPKPFEMNVLIIGETGVGKSTFINAFVNYLAYETLEEAEQNQTITVLPASFVITVGYDFDTIQVNIGEEDPNENFASAGASVTQNCMSYIIPLRSNLHLRLIDTPGMGDTRGIEQDVINIDHILNYLGTLSELHAVLFVLKPNVSRLDIFFRSCLNQLFTYLTPSAYNNIIFAFTSARSTFYAPGDTGPSLRKNLRQNQLEEIPFGKTNIFCFDNEAFRYLAAIRQGLTFDQVEKQEYIQSWTRSFNESVRLLKHIRTREAYSLERWHSDRRSTLEIKMMARPLVIKMRLMVYELLGHKLTATFRSMPKKLCSTCCAEQFQNVGDLSIYEFTSKIRMNAENCHCPDEKNRFLIESIVEYRYSDGSASNRESELNELLLKCDQLTRFVQEKRYDVDADPFGKLFDAWKRQEEESLRRNVGEVEIHEKVLEWLNNVVANRQIILQIDYERRSHFSLQEINELINSLKTLDGVEEHVKCVKETRQNQVKSYERFVRMRHINNSAFDESIETRNVV